MTSSAALRALRSSANRALPQARSSVRVFSPPRSSARSSRPVARCSTRQTHHHPHEHVHVSHSRFGIATASAACVLTGIVCERTMSSMEGQSGPAADSGMMYYSYYEPGTVEEWQHSLAECFGRTRIVAGTFTSGQSVWQLISETVDAFLGGGWRENNTSPEVYSDQQRILRSRTLNDSFPSLAVHLVNESGEHNEFELNSPVGIPIDNDLFVGRVMVLVRPHASICPKDHEQMLFSNRERFEFQLQGRFKRIPEGEVYCGAELADHGFRLGTLTRGLSTVLLRLLSQYVGPDMSYSFGGKNDSVLPHIAFPLKQAMQEVVVTPAGSTPPSLGLPFNESDESKSLRKAMSADEFNLDSTYSMSFASSCVDLPTWTARYPRSIALSTFWGNSPLRLVVYEKGSGDVQKAGNKYLLSIQLKFLGLEADSSRSEESRHVYGMEQKVIDANRLS
mmetsp:Transcript_9933/g.22207  ORF Transcript_9933/g.22207 Transcript_9933/m.22207 type:complete len:450 (-) Transcript_9933:94-1443(-)|eukprot:CAMPEP_0178568168 /NCGR_PEP_ID=MMETSP0697-20121206/15743_1 /TAXON_ID=265572 /ORGANISM="Extubocellulus spinifer, Strain CCMP396" /LENGTH=449 /DNA_ID=CAMNT_0020202207 /DNA_START=147 /DNA_END=1496 /DNA_ORIENTATION=+